MPWLSEQDAALNRSPAEAAEHPADVTRWMEDNSSAVRFCEGCVWLLLRQTEGRRQWKRKGWTLAHVDHPRVWRFSFTPAWCFYLQGHKSVCNSVYLLITLVMAFYPTPMVLRFAKCSIPMATIPYVVTLVRWCVNQYYYGEKCLKRLQKVCCGDSVQDCGDYSAQQVTFIRS